MNMKHTPGPWFLKRSGTVAERLTGKVIATTGYNVVANGDEDDANDARIVACVNACEGISNEALSLGGPFAAAKAAIVQRDELAAALRMALAYNDAVALADGTGQFSWGPAARAALAKVQS